MQNLCACYNIKVECITSGNVLDVRVEEKIMMDGL